MTNLPSNDSQALINLNMPDLAKACSSTVHGTHVASLRKRAGLQHWLGKAWHQVPTAAEGRTIMPVGAEGVVDEKAKLIKPHLYGHNLLTEYSGADRADMCLVGTIGLCEQLVVMKM